MKYLPYFFLIFSIPFGVLSRFMLAPSVYVYLHDILVLLILLIFVKAIVRFLVTSKKTTLYYSLGLLMSVSLLGIITHVGNIQEFFISVLYMVRLAAYMLILIPLISAPQKTLNKLSVSMVVSGFLFVFFGYVQYIFYPNLRNLYYLGWDEHLYRLFSTFLDPNFAGIYILLVLVLFLSFVFASFNKSRLFTKIFFIFGLVYLTTALFLTYSRSVYIVSVFSLMLYLTLLSYKKLVAVIFVVFLVGIFLLPQDLGGEGVNLLRTASIHARVDSILQGLVIFINNPIIGVGYNTLRFVQVEYGFVLVQDALVSHAAAGFPNSFVVILATTGIIGFSLAIYVLSFVGRYLYKMRSNHDRKKSLFSTAIFISYVVLLFSSLFENTLFYGIFVLWIVLEIGIVRGISTYES